MTNYYNEIDKDAAAWLRNLIAEGHIAPGDVDERSIEDVRPDELAGYTQCHFFAGLGFWSLALRRAGWPDDREVWTGSCPCQPFSAAGSGAAFADERHLWPAFFHLISQRRPGKLFGEQVASKDANPWLDLVHADMEALGYAFGACAFPSAGVGAPHIRDRTYWVADAECSGVWSSGHGPNGAAPSPLRAEIWEQRIRADIGAVRDFESSILDHTDNTGLQGHAGHDGAAGRQGPSGPVTATGVSGGLGNTGPDHDAGEKHAASDGQSKTDRPANISGGPGAPFSGVADANIEIQGGRGIQGQGQGHGEGAGSARKRLAGLCADGNPSPTNGHWGAADWLYCRDARWRPVEPGTFPLAHGLPVSMGKLSPELRALAEVAGLSGDSLKRAKQYRVGGLRGYGNAINVMAAAVFIRAAA